MFVLELDDFAMPTFFFEALDDWDGVLSVSIRSLVGASNRLEDADAFVSGVLLHIDFLEQYLYCSTISTRDLNLPSY
jgi:hypothetical protein